jgi:hypothetical protein
VSIGAGLALALLSAFALNWGWLEQHGAAQEMPPLSLRRPLTSLRLLFADRTWLVGFIVGLAGWAFYIAALALAPLSLVQATSAGGIGLLATLAHRRGHVVRWPAVWIAVAGLALIGVSLAGGTAHGSTPSFVGLTTWIAMSSAVAAALTVAPSLAPGAGLGLGAGTLYAAGDVGTKAAVHGGLWLAFVPIVLFAHGAAFILLQLGFQRGSPLATAGTSTLLTNALPIAAGITLFHEHLPGGALGVVRLIAFACVVVAAAQLARQPSETTRSEISTADPALPRNSAS